jgi:hypothetical protein
LVPTTCNAGNPVATECNCTGGMIDCPAEIDGCPVNACPPPAVVSSPGYPCVGALVCPGDLGLSTSCDGGVNNVSAPCMCLGGQFVCAANEGPSCAPPAPTIDAGASGG